MGTVESTEFVVFDMNDSSVEVEKLSEAAVEKAILTGDFDEIDSVDDELLVIADRVEISVFKEPPSKVVDVAVKVDSGIVDDTVVGTVIETVDGCVVATVLATGVGTVLVVVILDKIEVEELLVNVVLEVIVDIVVVVAFIGDSPKEVVMESIEVGDSVENEYFVVEATVGSVEFSGIFVGEAVAADVGDDEKLRVVEVIVSDMYKEPSVESVEADNKEDSFAVVVDNLGPSLESVKSNNKEEFVSAADVEPAKGRVVELVLIVVDDAVGIVEGLIVELVLIIVSVGPSLESVVVIDKEDVVVVVVVDADVDAVIIVVGVENLAPTVSLEVELEVGVDAELRIFIGNSDEVEINVDSSLFSLKMLMQEPDS